MPNTKGSVERNVTVKRTGTGTTVFFEPDTRSMSIHTPFGALSVLLQNKVSDYFTAGAEMVRDDSDPNNGVIYNQLVMASGDFYYIAVSRFEVCDKDGARVRINTNAIGMVKGSLANVAGVRIETRLAHFRGILRRILYKPLDVDYMPFFLGLDVGDIHDNLGVALEVLGTSMATGETIQRVIAGKMQAKTPFEKIPTQRLELRLFDPTFSRISQVGGPFREWSSLIIGRRETFVRAAWLVSKGAYDNRTSTQDNAQEVLQEDLGYVPSLGGYLV